MLDFFDANRLFSRQRGFLLLLSLLLVFTKFLSVHITSDVSVKTIKFEMSNGKNWFQIKNYKAYFEFLFLLWLPPFFPLFNLFCLRTFTSPCVCVSLTLCRRFCFLFLIRWFTFVNWNSNHAISLYHLHWAVGCWDTTWFCRWVCVSV